MHKLNRTVVLNTLILHETLTIHDIGKTENMGFVPDKVHLQFLLDELIDSGHLATLEGVQPITYTITDKGIVEGKSAQEE